LPAPLPASERGSIAPEVEEAEERLEQQENPFGGGANVGGGQAPTAFPPPRPAPPPGPPPPTPTAPPHPIHQPAPRHPRHAPVPPPPPPPPGRRPSPSPSTNRPRAPRATRPAVPNRAPCCCACTSIRAASRVTST